MAVSGTTKALKDIMRIDAGINGDAQYIEQITWMLFLKAFDYKEQEWELTEDDYYPMYSNGISLEYMGCRRRRDNRRCLAVAY